MTSEKSEELSRYSLKLHISVSSPKKTDAIKKVGTLREELQALIDLDAEDDSFSHLEVNRNLFSWF